MPQEDAMGRLRAALEHADRLATLGRLSAALAHEMRNPLAAASLALHAVARELDAGRAVSSAAGDAGASVADAAFARAAEAIEELHAIIGHLAQLTTDVGVHSRSRAVACAEVDLDEVARASLRLTKASHYDLEATCALGAAPVVLGHPLRLVQVAVNLLANAAHAVRRAGPPARRIVITTGAQDGQAVLTVDDDGPGVPADQRAAVFAPFVSGHYDADATGLGLWLCAQIVGDHGGTIEVLEGPLGGARVVVRLPSAAAAASGPA